MNKKYFVILFCCVSLMFTGCTNNSNIPSNINNTTAQNQINSNDNCVLIYNTIEKSILNSDWKKYFPKYYPSANNNLVGKSINDTNKILGTPYIIIKNSAKELKDKKESWIYMINRNKEDADNSALYIHFSADEVNKYEINDYNGIDEENLSGYLK